MAGPSRAQVLPDIHNAVAGFFLETQAPVNRVAKQPRGVMDSLSSNIRIQ